MTKGLVGFLVDGGLSLDTGLFIFFQIDQAKAQKGVRETILWRLKECFAQGVGSHVIATLLKKELGTLDGGVVHADHVKLIWC